MHFRCEMMNLTINIFHETCECLTLFYGPDREKYLITYQTVAPWMSGWFVNNGIRYATDRSRETLYWSRRIVTRDILGASR